MASRPRDLPLSAPATEGLNALDRDRAGSLVDEGGASAAALEARYDEPRSDAVRLRRARSGSWRAAALLTAGAFGILATWSVVRRRGRAS